MYNNRVGFGVPYQLWRMPFLAVLLVSLAIAGCGSPNSDSTAATSTSTATPGTAQSSPKDLKETDWKGIITDLDCTPINRGIEVRGVRFADVRGQGVEDAFVWAVCYHETSPWPHQLEVFDGSSDPANPRKIAVLISMDEYILIESLTFSGHAVTVHGASYAEQDATCCPSIPVQHVFVWTGGQFRRGSG